MCTLQKLTTTTILFTVFLINSAYSTPFNATYTSASGDDLLSFLFEGTVQADGDTVFVDEMLSVPTINGVAPEAADPLFGYIISSSGPSSLPAFLTFSGTNAEFIYVTNFAGWNSPNGFPVDGFHISAASGVMEFNVVFGNTYVGNGGFFSGYNPSRWSLTEVVPVTAPSTLSVLMIGLAMLRLRKKREDHLL